MAGLRWPRLECRRHTDRQAPRRTHDRLGEHPSSPASGRLCRPRSRAPGHRVEDSPLWTLLEVQDLLDEWITLVWQNRPHDGLRDPLAPCRAFTPNEKYAALIETAGFSGLCRASSCAVSADRAGRGRRPVQHRHRPETRHLRRHGTQVAQAVLPRRIAGAGRPATRRAATSLPRRGRSQGMALFCELPVASRCAADAMELPGLATLAQIFLRPVFRSTNGEPRAMESGQRAHSERSTSPQESDMVHACGGPPGGSER